MGRVWLAWLAWLALAQAPPGWRLVCSRAGDCEAGVDSSVARAFRSSGFIEVKAHSGWGALEQDLKATHYGGRRMRLSGFIRTENVKGGAGLFLRVDGADRRVLASDDMRGRRLRGTNEWTYAEVVLDIPANATGITYGLLLEGSGKAWVDFVKLEEVSTDTPVTARRARWKRAIRLQPDYDAAPERPANLDFEQQRR